MCIIVVKRHSQPLPTDSVLKACWDSNPDGAGFMYAKGGKVHIEKGFMKFKKLMEALEALPADVLKAGMILHFRIGTHGAVSKECTHPFPVCNDYDLMRETSSECDIGMAHNGVISFAASHKDVKKEQLISDSMWFANNVASKYIELLEFDDTFNIHPLMNAAIGGNKFAFMKGNGYIWVVGDWGTIGDKEPIWYSNNSHTYVRTRCVNVNNQCDFFGGGAATNRSPASKSNSGGVSKYVPASEKSVVITVTEEQRARVLDKINDVPRMENAEAPSCTQCLFRLQLDEPCATCFSAPTEYACFVPIGKQAAMSKGPSLCLFCDNTDKRVSEEPCKTCAQNRSDTGISSGFIKAKTATAEMLGALTAQEGGTK